MNRRAVAGVAVALALLLVAVALQRHRLIVFALSFLEPPALLDAADEGESVRWVDDYFTVQVLDSRTFAIGEPRYAQQVYNYLIAGSERAVLFDAGPGLRDIRPVAAALTDRPITFVPSHFHYDHVGNQVTFDHVAVIDLPYLRERAPDGRLTLTAEEHLGAAEQIDAPTLEVDEWLAPGSAIDLGERTLHVLYTPGHTEDSISLFDPDSGDVFTGDFLYPGPLFAFLPNSGMGDYLEAANGLRASIPAEARLRGAHRVAPPGAPVLHVDDLEDLQEALRAIRDGALEGEGLYPVTYRVNERIDLLAEPAWLQDWTPRRPVEPLRRVGGER